MDSRADDFLSFVCAAPSPYHVTKAAVACLTRAGFNELSETEPWEIKAGGRYFCTIYDSALVAFAVGQTSGAMRLAVAHTDWPCLRLKPQAGWEREGYSLLNVEGYGGLILRAWLDRPLALAGKVVLGSGDAFKPVTRLFDSKQPVALIPGLAIHYERDINEKGALNCQTDMLPLVGLTGELSSTDDESVQNAFLTWLAQKLEVSTADILAYELSAYPVEKGRLCGLQNEFVISPRLDNLTSVWACLNAIQTAKPTVGLSAAFFFDHEEIGSRTKQGAGSGICRQILAKMYRRLGWSKEALDANLREGFMLSTDVAHALHPHHVDKNDPVVKPILGGGVVIKQAAAQNYVGDAEAVAIVKALAAQRQIPHQEFVNRSDQKGGATLGSLISAALPIRGMDVGVPILAMHSAMETMAWADQAALTELLTEFWDYK